LCKNQRVEALTTAASREVSLPEALGVEFGFGMVLAGLIHGGIGQAEHDPPDDAQDQGGVRGAHPAEVFLHANVQTVVQPAFDDPVLAFESEQAPSLQLLQAQAADQMDHFATPLAVAFDARLQPGH
jgi:hypothetical protein